MYYITLAYFNLFIAAFNFMEEKVNLGLMSGFGAVVFMLMAIYQKLENDKK